MWRTAWWSPAVHLKGTACSAQAVRNAAELGVGREQLGAQPARAQLRASSRLPPGLERARQPATAAAPRRAPGRRLAPAGICPRRAGNELRAGRHGDLDHRQRRGEGRRGTARRPPRRVEPGVDDEPEARSASPGSSPQLGDPAGRAQERTDEGGEALGAMPRWAGTASAIGALPGGKRAASSTRRRNRTGTRGRVSRVAYVAYVERTSTSAERTRRTASGTTLDASSTTAPRARR